MPDYSLGRAHGKIEIDYDGSGADKAARDLDKVAESSTSADESLSKTQKTLGDTDRQMRSSSTSAEGYSARLRDVRQASDDVEAAERRYKSALLDTKSTTDDIEGSLRNLEDARKRHTTAIDSERDAHRALSDTMSVGGRVMDSLKGIIPNLTRHFDDLSNAEEQVTDKATGLSQAISGVAKIVGFLGPEGKAAAAGLLLASDGIDKVSSSANTSGSAIGGFIKDIAGLELAVGKVSGLALSGGALGGLAGLGGGAGLMGIVEMADAVKQLAGGLALLPAVISGVGFSMGTMELAFHGVGDALKDMMSDDPKKFLEDISNMGPAAAQSMLAIAQFRDQFKLVGGAVQDSFFAKIAADIAPLIQTWLPAVAAGMSQIAGIFGDAAHELAGLLQQPVLMQQFQSFIANLAAGLQALQPAMTPLLNIFQELAVVGSSFFAQIGGKITTALDGIASWVDKATGSGQLQSWIQDSINAFGHLVGILENVGSAFMTIMDVAERFGGGGLLGWLEELSVQLNNWTQSAEGQKALTDFFTVLRQATDAFLPMLQPLLQGFASLGSAFAQLGLATAPGWQQFFDMFAQSMATLGPQIATIGPAINQFLYNLGVAMINLVNQVGPQLPALFNVMSNAFSALLPQIGPLVNLFMQLVQAVGPQLPALFGAVTQALIDLVPLMPTITGFMRDFVSIITLLLEGGDKAEVGLQKIVDGIVKIGNAIIDGLSNHALKEINTLLDKFFNDLGPKAKSWGETLIKGLIDGMLGGLGPLGGVAKTIVETIASWFPSSPAKQGPFSGSGYTLVRGRKMVEDMAAGMASAQSAVEDAAASTATAASTALGARTTGAGGAPAAGGADAVAGALLPPNIAGADTSILSAYLRHQFPENRGLKGLAKDLGKMLEVAQSGFNLINQHVLQPMFQALGLIPGMNQQTWKKMSPEDFAAQQQEELQRKALDGNKKQGPTWGDVFGQGSPAATPTGGPATPLGLTASSSKEDIQKGIIAAGRARGMNDAAIQTALAVAAAESGFDPTISGGVQGSAGLVSGLFQQSPSSGWGTLDQVNDPNHAINAFYDAYAKQLAQNPTDPLLAAVLTQNPQLGSGAQGSDYWNAVSAKLGQGNQILAQQGPGVKTGPTWAQITGAGAPAALPPGQPMQGTYGLPTGTNTGGYGTGNGEVFPPWVMAIAQAFGIKPSTYGGHQESDRNEAGYAPNPQHLNRGIDWTGPTDSLQKFADYLSTIPQDLEQVIFQNPVTGRKTGIGGGQINPGYYPQSTYDEHGGNDPSNIHVHTRQSAPIPLPSTPMSQGAASDSGLVPSVGSGLGSDVVPRPVPVAGSGVGNGVVLPSGIPLQQLVDNTSKSASANDQLLQAYLQGNPALASQIDAAKTPGASDETVLGSLNSISSTITDLKTQDAVGNKNTISALQSTQNQIAQGAGFQQAPSGLSQAQSIASGIGSAISGAFQVAQDYLNALTATQDIADRLVYGVRNTEDINKLIDDYQKYITLAASIISEAGNIVSAVGAFTGGADMGGTSAAGTALSLIAGVLQGINAAIDFGQQVYHIVGTYVGRALSFLTAGIGGTPLMGDVRFLLNKNTNQLITYSEDNPQNKNTLNVPTWLQPTYDAGNGSNPNPQVNTQWNIYAGPGQSPGEMLNETMWMYNTAGTSGAMSPANF